METLRAEVIQNLVDGQITHETVQNFVFIDSFLRESARFNVAGLGKPSQSLFVYVVHQSPHIISCHEQTRQETIYFL